MSSWHHFWRVYFEADSSVRVLAQTEAGARRAAIARRRMVGYRGDALRVSSVTEEGHASTGQQHCPRCGQSNLPGLAYNPTPATLAELREVLRPVEGLS